jgi:hypothetical protein
MPDQSPTRIRYSVAAGSAVVLLLCTAAYAVLAALGDVPWAVVLALLVATAVYGLFVWLGLGRVGRRS